MRTHVQSWKVSLLQFVCGLSSTSLTATIPVQHRLLTRYTTGRRRTQWGYLGYANRNIIIIVIIISESQFMQSFNVFNLLAARVLTVVTLSYTLMEAKPLSKWRAFISATLYKTHAACTKKRERNNSILFYGVSHHLGLKAWWCASLDSVVINISAFPEMWFPLAGGLVCPQETFWGDVSSSFWNHYFLFLYRLLSKNPAGSRSAALGAPTWSNAISCCSFPEVLLTALRYARLSSKCKHCGGPLIDWLDNLSYSWKVLSTVKEPQQYIITKLLKWINCSESSS